MIKLVTLLKRRAGMSRPEFEHRWLNIHAPIAAEFPGLRGYVLSFSILEGEPGADGVAQLWFDDRRSAQRSYASEIGRNGSDDARQHLSRRDHLLVSEHWIAQPESVSPDTCKLMIGLKRIGGQDRAAFIRHLEALDRETLCAALGSRIVRLCVDEAGQQLSSGVSGDLDLFESEAVHDAILESWHADADDLRRAAEDAPALIDDVLSGRVDKTELFLLKDHVIVAPPTGVEPRPLASGVAHR